MRDLTCCLRIAGTAVARQRGMKPFLALCCLLLAACRGVPTAPSNQTLTAPAVLQRVGELQIKCDENSCRFSGAAENSGAGCAAGVLGTTSFWVVGEYAARFKVSTTISTGMVWPNASFDFSGEFSRKLLIAMLPTDWYSRTAFEWRDVRCP